MAHGKWCLGEPCLNKATVSSVSIASPGSPLLLASPLALGTNVCSAPGLLLAGPQDRLRLKVMLTGALQCKRRLATCQVVLRVMSSVCKLRFCLGSWVSKIPPFPECSLALFSPVHSFLTLCKLSILTTLWPCHLMQTFSNHY